MADTGGMTDDDPFAALARIRELHRPRWYNGYYLSGQVWLVCHGCDEGAHAEVPASWPCSTAATVYTAEETAAREPVIAECAADHGTRGDGLPVRPQAVFLLRDGGLVAARWNCGHVTPVPAESADPW